MCLQHIRDPDHPNGTSAQMADVSIGAIAPNAKHFFTGFPCRNGHIAPRYVLNERCVACVCIKRARYRNENKERVKESKKLSDLKNKDRKSKYAKAYHEKNREKLLEKKKIYNSLTKEQRRQRDRAYYFQNKEIRSLGNKAWRKKNKHVARTYRRKRRALLSGASGSHTIKDLREIFLLQKSRCAHCRVRFNKIIIPTLDHIVALSKGGSEDRRNLQYLCGPCNSAKKNLDPIDFARRQGMLL